MKRSNGLIAVPPDALQGAPRKGQTRENSSRNRVAKGDLVCALVAIPRVQKIEEAKFNVEHRSHERRKKVSNPEVGELHLVKQHTYTHTYTHTPTRIAGKKVKEGLCSMSVFRMCCCCSKILLGKKKKKQWAAEKIETAQARARRIEKSTHELQVCV
jgi:hypothetical protein